MPEPTKKPGKPGDSETPGLDAALLELQKTAMMAKQTGDNPHLGNKYSTLEDTWDACRDRLNEVGVVAKQFTQTAMGDGLEMVTELVHAESGEKQRSTLPVVWGSNESGRSVMQSLGSALTYSRRYGLLTAVGIISEDDDGNAAGTGARAKSSGGGAPSRPTTTSTAPASTAQIGFLKNLLDKKQCSPEWAKAVRDKIAAGKLTKADASTAIEKLQAAPNKSDEAELNDQANADAAAGAGEAEAAAEADAKSQAIAADDEARANEQSDSDAAAAQASQGDTPLDEIPF